MDLHWEMLMPHLKMSYWMWMQTPLAGSRPQAVFGYKQIIYFLYKKTWQTVVIAYGKTVRAALKPQCVLSRSFCTSLSCWAAQSAMAGAGRGVVLGAGTRGPTPPLTAAWPHADLRGLWTSIFWIQHFTFQKLYPDREIVHPTLWKCMKQSNRLDLFLGFNRD